ncbi:MAG: oxygen-dependent coproporphyrinogen oxidase [Gammaproteobacteria bacterium]|nr:oxygen-dependent coproporphyrinogen oxidase [Gammaproteobacteria bacterium]MBV9622261.1 oxygen-dependent coproporphyrinogen oxidase [Gammaproteobacteria bacterium]
MSDAESFAAAATADFRDLQGRLCRAFEAFEPTARFAPKSWARPAGHRLQGGGWSALLRGDVFEKVGVNVSHVWGTLAPESRGQVAGARESEGRFSACGLSLVAHMANPYTPTVHMNLRYLTTRQAWFGGGADLTPTFPIAEDTAEFHGALQAACDAYRPGAYGEFKAWCDRYFYLPHRQEPRGVGGIFFDDLASGDRARDYAFVRSVGEALLEVFPRIVARRKDTPFDAQAREQQLLKRGRYVEFNLVYDRGTRFGFSTDADPEAYLMSLPPLAKW